MPMVMIGVVGVLLLGLLVVFAFSGNNAGPAPATLPPNSQATATPIVIDVGGDQPPVSGSTPPRMPLAEFKALYDNQASRPVVVDVRSEQAFAEGHIAGSINVPYDQVGANIEKLPKDRLIVAYCQ